MVILGIWRILLEHGLDIDSEISRQRCRLSN